MVAENSHKKSAPKLKKLSLSKQLQELFIMNKKLMKRVQFLEKDNKRLRAENLRLNRMLLIAK